MQDLYKKEKVIGPEWNVLFFLYEGIEETDVDTGLAVILFAVTYLAFIEFMTSTTVVFTLLFGLSP